MLDFLKESAENGGSYQKLYFPRTRPLVSTDELSCAFVVLPVFSRQFAALETAVIVFSSKS